MNKRILIILESAILVIAGIVLLVIMSIRNDRNQSSSDTPTTAATEGVSPTEVMTNTPAVTATPYPTGTPVPTGTATPEPTETPTVEPTATPTPTPTKAAASPTPTSTPKPTPTSTPKPTPTSTPKPTPMATPTPTVKPTDTATPTPSATPKPGKPTATPTPTYAPPVVNPDEWSPTNLPDGFSSEKQLVDYLADYIAKNDVAPTLKRCGFTYVSHEVIDSGNKIGPWKAYRCRVTAVLDKTDRATIEVDFVVYGGHYAARIINGKKTVSYVGISDYWDGKRAGGSSNPMSDAELTSYLERVYHIS